MLQGQPVCSASGIVVTRGAGSRNVSLGLWVPMGSCWRYRAVAFRWHSRLRARSIYHSTSSSYESSVFPGARSWRQALSPAEVYAC